MKEKAKHIDLLNFSAPPMRAFHLSWISFLVCFVAWFGIAPMMAIVRVDLKLTPAQIANTVIASVLITVLARLAAGWLCDRFGARRTYAALLVIGALPVMGIGLAHSYHSFLLFRLAIGAIGASFVISQYHTSVMFAPNVVGTANAVTAGWGNLGGGATQIMMPLLVGGFLSLGVDRFVAWRLAMVVPGIAMVLAGIAYYAFAQDSPDGSPLRTGGAANSFLEAARDYRVWVLFLLYAACFGIEITMDNTAALYFTDTFHLTLQAAGLMASAVGMMNIFARALGGWLGDGVGGRWNLRGRVLLLGSVILAEGIALAAFSAAREVLPAIALFLLFGLFVCMACGATYAVVPFMSESAVGAVSGIVGAGGNAGAVAASFLFKMKNQTTPHVLFTLGVLVAATSLLAPILCLRRTTESVAPGEEELELVSSL